MAASQKVSVLSATLRRVMRMMRQARVSAAVRVLSYDPESLEVLKSLVSPVSPMNAGTFQRLRLLQLYNGPSAGFEDDRTTVRRSVPPR